MKSSALAVAEPVVAAPAPSRRGRRNPINDLDLKNWKQYEEIQTDSLWIIDERDSSGAHRGDYHGNFVPQIPRQAMQRYTRKGDVVLDVFLGSGTTMIEAQRLGRNCIGIELQQDVADRTRERVESEENVHGIEKRIYVEDSGSAKARMRVANGLKDLGRDRLQMIIAHPPYHDIIRFSQDPRDLSNSVGNEGFVEDFGKIVANFTPFLDKGRYFVLVIGDKYENGEWIPLGFQTMQAVLDCGYVMKSLVVKNMCDNRAKRNLQQLWRYRALYGGFHVFRHEYVMYFKKK